MTGGMSARNPHGPEPPGSTRGDRHGDAAARARAVLRVGGPLLGLSVLVSLLAAGPLGGEDVVLHRGLDGEPTRTGPARELLVLFPVFAAMTFGTMLVAAYAAGPRRDGRRPPSPGALAATTGAVMGVFVAIHALALAEATGMVRSVFEPTFAVMGLALVAGGALFLAPRTARAALTTVNLPLPASSDRQARVGRLAGRSFLAVGVATLLAAAAGPPWLAVTAMVGGLVVLAVALVVVCAGERSAERSARGG